MNASSVTILALPILPLLLAVGCGPATWVESDPCHMEFDSSEAHADSAGRKDRRALRRRSTELPSPPAHAAVVWQGFEQSWSYNHRWNRFGNFVAHREAGPQPCVELRQSAASGIGPDVAVGRSNFEVLRSRELEVLGASDSILIEGAQGERVEATQRLSVPVGPDQHVEAGQRFHLFLNGWDLIHVGDDADKPVEFALNAGDAVWDAASDTLELEYSVVLRMDCTTAECKAGDGFEYRLDTHWLVLGGSEDVLDVTTDRFEEGYGWRVGRPGDELFTTPRSRNISGSRFSTDAVLAWKGISLRLGDGDSIERPKGHHMLEWASLIEPVAFDGSRYDFELSLLFKNWTHGMQDARAPYSWMSFGVAGTAELAAEIALVQVGEAVQQGRCSWDESVDWTDVSAPVEQGSEATALFFEDGQVAEFDSENVSCR
jgi:hypothetical protein